MQSIMMRRRSSILSHKCQSLSLSLPSQWQWDLKVKSKVELRKTMKQMAISSIHSFILVKNRTSSHWWCHPKGKKSRILLCVLPGDVQVANRRCAERRLSKDRASENRSVNVENMMTVRVEKRNEWQKSLNEHECTTILDFLSFTSGPYV
jgi:hypothetical protein